ncbi:MAG: cell division protein FtsL [Gammaproteobacteria bacterium RIFCSPHIGHO2_12_FULL_42_13]|nr:MAG: cell division protein FtsL [Gammaproteobacteria bacterium RIFCSPHIGHO2_12_FULL_42_13]
MLTRAQMTLVILVVALLVSALGIIYTTQETRRLHATLQHNFIDRDRMHVQWGQLLLERGVWTMQARIQHIAEEQLGMMVPDHKSVVIIRE